MTMRGEYITKIPTEVELVEVARESSQAFYGHEVEIPTLPKNLLPDATRLHKEGFTNFEPKLFSGAKFDRNSDFPGQKIKPHPFFWEVVGEGWIPEEAANLRTFWALVDTTERPDFLFDNPDFTSEQCAELVYRNDPFGPILEQLRAENLVETIREGANYIPVTSRLAISTPYELEHVVIPRLAHVLGVAAPARQVEGNLPHSYVTIDADSPYEPVETPTLRLPTFIEYTYAGNLYYPEWGEKTTLELLADMVGPHRGDPEDYVIRYGSGDLDQGGVGDFRAMQKNRHASSGWRLLIEYPTEAPGDVPLNGAR